LTAPASIVLGAQREAQTAAHRTADRQASVAVDDGPGRRLAVDADGGAHARQLTGRGALAADGLDRLHQLIGAHKAAPHEHVDQTVDYSLVFVGAMGLLGQQRVGEGRAALELAFELVRGAGLRWHRRRSPS
jgi:hypothetical protein